MALIYIYIYALMIIYDKSRHHPDISTVGLGFPSRLQLARLRPSPPWSCAVWMQNAPVLLPHGEWNTKTKMTKTIETMSNIVKPRLSWTFHGPFMSLCRFQGSDGDCHLWKHTFRYFQPFSILFFSNPCLVWLPNQLGICAQGPPILHPFPRKPSSPGTSCCGSLKPSWTFYIASAWSYSIIFDPSTKLN